MLKISLFNKIKSFKLLNIITYIIFLYVVFFNITILKSETTEKAINYFNTSLGKNPLKKINKPLEFSADNISFNSKLNLIIATGNIVIIQDNQIIKADKAYIQKDKNYILAKGNIYIKDTDNKELFGDEIEIQNTLNDVIIENLKMLFTDNSLLASQKIIKKDNLITTHYASYTACPFSRFFSPFWSIKASKITYNQKTRTIKLYNGWLQIKEVPLIWIPYISYSDPKIKRRFGLLTPSVGSNSVLGYYYMQPIFFPINDYTDLTFKLTYFQKNIPLIKKVSKFKNNTKPLFQASYSKYFKNSEININTSYTNNNNNDWSIFSFYKKDINDILRLKINYNNATSRNFLTLYNINNYSSKESFLLINTTLEAFLNNNNYLQITLDGTKNINNTITIENNPITLPQISFKHFGNSHKYGKIDINFHYANFLTSEKIIKNNIPYENNFNLQKLILELNHSIKKDTKIGIFYLDTQAQSVNYYKNYLYIINNYLNNKNYKNLFDRYLGASIAAKIEYPFYSQWGSYSNIINPIAQISTSNFIYNKIHNLSYLDSNQLDISILNLFENNKYTGFDSYPKGSRFNYGLQWDLINNEGFSGQMLVGQSVYLNNNDKSNYLLYIFLQPSPYLKLNYTSIIDNKLSKFNQNNFNIFLGNSILGTYLNYRALNNLNTSIYNVSSLEELQPAIYVKLSHNLQLTTIATFNLKNSTNAKYDCLKHLESLHALLSWQNSCFSFSVKISRNFYGNTDMKSHNSYQFAFMLKNLGGTNVKLKNYDYLNPYFIK